jgi:activating signal cointegrator complex subunit 3
VGRIRNALADPGFAGDEAEALVGLLADVQEYEELPVRHNEDVLNATLAEQLRWSVRGWDMGSSHTKAFLLLQAHLERARLPIADYVNDTKSVLDQAPRLLNAMVDIAADEGLLQPALGSMRVAQMLVQACTDDRPSLLQLPSLGRLDDADGVVRMLEAQGVGDLRALASLDEAGVRKACRGLGGLDPAKVVADLRRVPLVTVASLRVLAEEGGVEVERDAASGRPLVGVDQDYVLEISLRCRGGGSGGGGGGKPLASGRFHKQVKAGGWWLALGEGPEELLALKRFAAGGGGERTMTVTLSFPAPLDAGPAVLDLYLVADGIRGLDQQVEVHLEALPGEGGEGTGEEEQEEEGEEEGEEDEAAEAVR